MTRYFRVTKWLPTNEGGVSLNANLSQWESHFAKLGINTQIRRGEDGKVSLWREGVDATGNGYEES